MKTKKLNKPQYLIITLVILNVINIALMLTVRTYTGILAYHLYHFWEGSTVVLLIVTHIYSVRKLRKGLWLYGKLFILLSLLSLVLLFLKYYAMIYIKYWDTVLSLITIFVLTGLSGSIAADKYNDLYCNKYRKDSTSWSNMLFKIIKRHKATTFFILFLVIVYSVYRYDTNRFLENLNRKKWELSYFKDPESRSDTEKVLEMIRSQPTNLPVINFNYCPFYIIFPNNYPELPTEHVPTKYLINKYFGRNVLSDHDVMISTEWMVIDNEKKNYYSMSYRIDDNYSLEYELNNKLNACLFLENSIINVKEYNMRNKVLTVKSRKYGYNARFVSSLKN